MPERLGTFVESIVVAKNRRNLNDRTLSLHLRLCNMSLLVEYLFYIVGDEMVVS